MPSCISCLNSSRGRKAGLWTQLTSCQYSGRRLWFLPYSPLSIPTLAPIPVSIIPRVCGDNRNSKLRLEEGRETILSSESLAYRTLAARASIPQQRLQIFVAEKCMFLAANIDGFQLKTSDNNNSGHFSLTCVNMPHFTRSTNYIHMHKT